MSKRSNSHIPFQLTKQIKNENGLNREKKLIDWIQNQIATRVLVLGAPGSGKTTFIQLATDQSKFPTENMATDGISITNVNNSFTNKNNIMFWDFGGQESSFFYSQIFFN